MKTLILAFIATTLAAQEVTRLIEYKPDDSDQADRLAILFQKSGVRTHNDSVLGLMSLSGNAEAVTNAEATFRKHYKPRVQAAKARNVELTLSVLSGKSGAADAGSIPMNLRPTVQEIGKATGLTEFRLVESQVIRVRSGERLVIAGVLQLAGGTNASPANYGFQAGKVSIEDSVAIKDLAFFARLPYPISLDEKLVQFSELSIKTSIDIKPGQQVVVGKANGPVAQGALILVLSAKAAD
jgi:hypothetical protein